MSGTPRAVAAVRSHLRLAWRHRLFAHAVDRTRSTTRRTCLVLAPHPDDESLGCGATIARKRAAGTRVVVAVAADGRSSHPHSRHVTPQELAAIKTQGPLESKRAAILMHGTQTTNVTGEAGWAVLDHASVEDFLQPFEVFIPLETTGTWA